MTTKDNGGAAFPFSPNDHSTARMTTSGMSLRDWFAGQALAWAGHDNWTSSDPRLLAERAYQMADAMLAARGKP